MVPKGWQAAEEGYESKERDGQSYYYESARERHVVLLQRVHVAVGGRSVDRAPWQCDPTVINM